MKLISHFISRFSAVRNIHCVLALLAVHCLQPTACPAFEQKDSCLDGPRAKNSRQCDIAAIRVPMTPSPASRTNTSAPVIVFPIRKMSSYRQVEEAPLAPTPCGLAPVSRSEDDAYIVERSRKSAPYFSGDPCPKAPIIVSYPSGLTGRRCE